MDFKTWTVSLREVLQYENAPVTLRNGSWKVIDHGGLWEAVGPRIFDDTLEVFKECAIEVLSEVDPQFELPVEERYAAAIYGNVLKHSSELRAGIAETLALIGTHRDALKNSSALKAEAVPILVIREVLESVRKVHEGTQ